MHFQHSADIGRNFPASSPGSCTPTASPATPSAALLAPAEPRFTFGA